jgi:hypothetical protein
MARNEQREGSDNVRSGARSVRNGRLTLFIGLAALAYYLLILGGHQYSIDGIAMFQAAKTLLFQHSWRFDPPLLWGGTFAVSIWSPGMTFAYVPLLVFWYPVFVWIPALRAVPYDPSSLQNPALYTNLPYLLCSLLNPLLTAGTACLVFRVGRLLRLGREWSALAALAYGFASPAAAYARYDLAQPLAALTLTATILGLLRAEETGSLRPLAWAGLAFGYGLLTRIEFVVLAPWMIGWVYLRSRRAGARGAWFRAGILAGAIILAILAYREINWLKFGNPTTGGYPPLSVLFPGSLARFAQGLAGLVVGPPRGLLFFFPLAWLALPGLRACARYGTGAWSLFGGVIAISLALYAAFRGWPGGGVWGPRFLLPIIPLLALAAAAWATAATGERRGKRRAVFLLLSAVGFVVSWNGILSDPGPFQGMVSQTRALPGTWITPFRPAASSLITGWLPQPGEPIDLFWVGLASGRLARNWSGSRLLGSLVPLVLVGVIAWAGLRMGRDLLRTPDRR